MDLGAKTLGSTVGSATVQWCVSHTSCIPGVVQQDWKHRLRWCPVAATAHQERHSPGARAELFAQVKVRVDPTLG